MWYDMGIIGVKLSSIDRVHYKHIGGPMIIMQQLSSATEMQVSSPLLGAIGMSEQPHQMRG
jgi:hypothetical protein